MILIFNENCRLLVATLVGLGPLGLGLLGLLGLGLLGLPGLLAAMLGGHLCVKVHAAATHSMNGLGAQFAAQRGTAELLVLVRFCCLAKHLLGVYLRVCLSKLGQMSHPCTFCHLDCVGYVLGYV